MNYTNQSLQNYEKCKLYLSYMDNMWSTDLADLQLLSRYNNNKKIALLVFSVNMHGLFNN